MSSGQKVAFSFLTAILIFAAFVLFANPRIFGIKKEGFLSQIETRFYKQAKIDEKQFQLDKLSESCNSYISNILAVIETDDNAYVKDESVKTFLLSEADPNKEKAKIVEQQRQDLTDELPKKLPGLEYIRLIDNRKSNNSNVSDNRRDIFYSSNPDDFSSSGKYTIFKNYDELKNEINAEDIVVSGDSPQKKFIFDQKRNRFIISFPFYRTDTVCDATLVCYFSFTGLLQYLTDTEETLPLGASFDAVSAAVLEDNSAGWSVYAGGFVTGLPHDARGGDRSISEFYMPIMKAWNSKSSSSLERILEGDDFTWLLLTNHSNPYMTLSAVYKSTVFELPVEIKILIYITVFITVLLIAFLIFSIRRDYMVKIRSRIKKVQMGIIKEYLDNHDKVEWNAIALQIAARKDDLNEEIKKSIGGKSKKYEKETNALLESSWDEILQVIGGRSEKNSESLSGATIDEIRRVLEEVLQSTELNVNVAKMAKVQAVNVEQVSADELEEVAELDDVEEIDEIENIDDAEDLTEVDEVESISDVEEIAEIEDSVEVEDVLEESLVDDGGLSPEVESIPDEDVGDEEGLSPAVSVAVQNEVVESIEDEIEIRLDDLDEGLSPSATLISEETLESDEGLSPEAPEVEPSEDDDALVETEGLSPEIQISEENEDFEELEELDELEEEPLSDDQEELYVPEIIDFHNSSVISGFETFISAEESPFASVDTIFAEDLCIGNEYTSYATDISSVENFVFNTFVPHFGQDSNDAVILNVSVENEGLSPSVSILPNEKIDSYEGLSLAVSSDVESNEGLSPDFSVEPISTEIQENNSDEKSVEDVLEELREEAAEKSEKMIVDEIEELPEYEFIQVNTKTSGITAVENESRFYTMTTTGSFGMSQEISELEEAFDEIDDIDLSLTRFTAEKPDEKIEEVEEVDDEGLSPLSSSFSTNSTLEVCPPQVCPPQVSSPQVTPEVLLLSPEGLSPEVPDSPQTIIENQGIFSISDQISYESANIDLELKSLIDSVLR